MDSYDRLTIRSFYVMMKVIDMMHRVPNTRKKHLEVTQGRKHDDEMH